jgi:hypothetical protein
MAATETHYIRFYICFSYDFTGTANDTINIFEAQEVGDAAEVTFGARIVAATNAINVGIGETAPTSWCATNLERGVWYCVELKCVNDPGANDGTIDLYLTREGDTASSTVSATQVGSLDQAAVTHGHLGVQDCLATTTGWILLDEFVHDDTDRVYPMNSRWGDTIHMTKTTHLFVGPGKITRATLIGANADNVLSIYDTDSANANGEFNRLLWLETGTVVLSSAQSTMPQDIHVGRGAYCVLTGTNPRATAWIAHASGYGSNANLIRHGLK